MPKYIVVAGGVMSGVGKGVTTASIGKILQEHGYRVTAIKIDPYINYDAGTLRPTEHGEVWVTDDGGEIDQDLGTYERFLNLDIPKRNNITTGQVYKTVIDRERQGEYLGQTVQFIPHIPDEIKKRLKEASGNNDFVLIETVGAGQLDYGATKIADLTILVLTPESGDEMQFMKGGLSELADVFVVNKADRPSAGAMEDSLKKSRTGIPIFKTIAEQRKGINPLYQFILTQV